MNTIFSNTQYDAIIVGARVAGAATGMLLARAGAKVLIVDREAEIGDTLSTHALMRPAVSLLAQWGLLKQIAASSPTITKTQIAYGNERISIPVKPTTDYFGLCAPRRWLLDKVMSNAAVEAGAELHTGLNCQQVILDRSGKVTGVQFLDQCGKTHIAYADIIIGADGRNSTIAKLVKSAEQRLAQMRSACVYTYIEGLPNEGYRWYYSEKTSAGLIPTTGNQHCFFALCPPKEFKTHFGSELATGLLNILAEWEPDIAERLAIMGTSEKPRRFLGAPGHMRQCAGPGWALVGDAGYFKDPITAHGITDAFRDAQSLADAILRDGAGNLSEYQNIRNELSADLFRITEQIASFEWTLDQLKELHLNLNNIMKAEQEHIVNTASQPKLAA